MATPERLKIEEQAEALYEFYRKEHPETCPDVPWVGLFGDTQELWIKEAEKMNEPGEVDDDGRRTDPETGMK